MSRYIPILASLALAAFVSSVTAQVDEITAVQKAAFRTAADTKAFHSTGKIAVICFSHGVEQPPAKGIQVPMMGLTDPTPALLKALGNVPLPVVKGSSCRTDPSRMGAIVDTSNRGKRTAMAIIMSPPVKVKEGLYKFLIERAFDLETARGFRCTAVKKGSVWTVAKCADGWVVG